MITTKEEAARFRSQLAQQSTVCQPFSFTLEVNAKASSNTVGVLPIPDGADFQMQGYNMEYDEAADKKEHLKVQFRQKVGNRAWSNDFEPVKSIATPGVRSATPVPRYGYRQFAGLVKANDQIVMEVTNSAAEDLKVLVVFTGVLWPITDK